MICQSRQQVLGHSCPRCGLYWIVLINPRLELEGITCSLHPGQAWPYSRLFGSPGLLVFLLDSGQGGPDVETPVGYP